MLDTSFELFKKAQVLLLENADWREYTLWFNKGWINTYCSVLGHEAENCENLPHSKKVGLCNQDWLCRLWI